MTSKRWRVLMFSPAFAPQGNSEAIVNGKLALAMLNADWEIEVISRIPTWEVTYDYGGAWAEPWNPLKPYVHEIKVPNWPLPRRFWDLVVSAARLHYPVDGIRWASRAYGLAVRLHSESPFDVVLSRAFPEAAHLPAMKLSGKFDLPWMANWNDPWLWLAKRLQPAGVRSDRRRRAGALARTVARRASWHTFPCENLRAAMCPLLHNSAMQRSSVVPHAALQSSRAESASSPREFVVTYVGKVWEGQSPERVFDGFSRFLRSSFSDGSPKLRFVGLSDYDLGLLASKYALQDHVENLGPHSYHESLRAMAESAVLLLIDSAEYADMVLAGKVADYAHSGRPILAITTSGSAISQLIGQRGGGLVLASPSLDAIAEGFGELFQHWKAGTLQKSYGSANLYTIFSPTAVVQGYDQLFRHVADGASP